MKPSFIISFVSFCWQRKKDLRKSYNALFSLSTLPCLLYLDDILINTVLSRFVCINTLIMSNYSVSRLNLGTSNNKIRRKVIATIIALVGRSWHFCWLWQNTILALHFWSWLYSSVIYFKIYWDPNFW